MLTFDCADSNDLAFLFPCSSKPCQNRLHLKNNSREMDSWIQKLSRGFKRPLGSVQVSPWFFSHSHSFPCCCCPGLFVLIKHWSHPGKLVYIGKKSLQLHMPCNSADGCWGENINDEILIHYLPGRKEHVCSRIPSSSQAAFQVSSDTQSRKGSESLPRYR